MLNLWNGYCPFHVVCQLSAGDIHALRAGFGLAPTHLAALEVCTTSGGSTAA